MTIQNVIADANSITVVGSGGQFFYISANDIVYGAVREYLIDQRGTDISRVNEIVTGVRDGVDNLIATAENIVDGRCGDDGDDGEDSYRLKHGDPVADVVFDTAVKLNLTGGDSAAVVKFLQRLERNPSEASRSQLFAWLQAGGFAITSEGLVVGYKAVDANGYSFSTGREPVTVTTADGKSSVITGKIPYPIGSTASMPRNLVDDNRDASCSVGLHVGTESYATGFGSSDGSVLVVLYDPAHVVSVPRCSSGQKVRVHQLYVAAYMGDHISDVVVTAFDADAARVFDSRPENQVAEEDFDDDGYLDDDLDEDDDDLNDDDLDDFDEDADDEDADDEDAGTVADPVVSEVRDRVVEIITEKPQMKGILDKRFSKKRRVLLTDVLQDLVSEGVLILSDSGVYSAV